ncbi:cardiolipin synthetase [Listeria floridensis FSL S10-1187]|uniref:Cardiolipin synthase n=1 Tax=Listeria floridensis FSL S10-1187 TaxID=1265817 RepID=A0ABP3AY31_9LIST|nr:cardiolipin synthase [Listeria floridensis]EUJ30557.1 cardiolipin synthetase [Listeria floridensis FSL S10-1187]
MKKRFQLIIIILVVALLGYVLQQWSSVILYSAGLVVEIAGIVIVIRLIFFDRRVTSSKVAWIAAIFVLPIFGVIIYLFFGRNPQNRVFHHNQTVEMKRITDKIHGMVPNAEGNHPPSLSKRIEHLTKIQPVDGNKLTLLTNGEETFPALLESLRAAKDHIHIQYYIYKSDEIGQEIREILIERAKAGVEIRFMYDDWGSAKLSEHFLEPMRNAGIQIHAFDPIRSLWVARTANLRNHRKIVVVDGGVGYTGGLNIGEEYRSNTKDFVVWRDTHIKVEGPAVVELQESFLVDWVYMENKAESAKPFVSEAGMKRYFSPEVKGDNWAQVIYGGPYDREKWVRDSMLDLMDSAKKSVWLTSPYFVPDEESLAVIRRVAMSGIDVRIILPGKGDRGISFHGSNGNIETMLEAGAKVYAYRDDSFVHAKLLLVDGERAAVGTANFDVRSFRLNHELMVFLYDRDEAIIKMEQDFELDFSESHLYTMEDMKRKSRWTKIKENLSSLLSPIL